MAKVFYWLEIIAGHHTTVSRVKLPDSHDPQRPNSPRTSKNATHPYSRHPLPSQGYYAMIIFNNNSLLLLIFGALAIRRPIPAKNNTITIVCAWRFNHEEINNHRPDRHGRSIMQRSTGRQ
jgi:hypothetical protein